MKKQPQVIISARKLPRQRRAQATVDAIHGATARLLKRDGLKSLTTNAIATVAGISIGSLYEYFPNKESILVDMACRILRADEAHLQAVLATSGKMSMDIAIRKIVNTLIGLHRHEPEVRRLVMGAHAAAGLRLDHYRAIERLSSVYREFAPWPLSDERLFVLARGVLGAVRAALEEQSPLLGTPEFENELVRLVWLMVAEAPRSEPTEFTSLDVS